MKKAILVFLVNLISVATIWGQTEIIFPEKSLSLNQSIKNQMKNAYFNLPVGGELILSVLSGKEMKKLNAKDKVGFSRSRASKLANYCKDSLYIHPLRITYIFTPLDQQKPVLSSTNASYRNFTNRSGIYNLVVSRSEYHSFSGFLDTTKMKSKIVIINQSESNYITGDFVRIYVPENAFDCTCEKIKFELKEYFELSDLLFSGLTTTSDDKLLETGGMLYLAAFCNSKRITLSKSINIQWVYEISQDGFQGFSGALTRKMINWEVDKNILLRNPVLTSDEDSWEEEDGRSNIDRLLITTKELGWINADKFLQVQNATQLIVKTKKYNAKTYVRLIFEDTKSILPGYFINSDKTRVEFSKIPSGKDSKLLIYEIVNKTNMKWAIIKVTTGEVGYIENIELKESSISEFKSKTKGIW